MKKFIYSVLFGVGLLFGSALVASAAGCNPFLVATGGTGVCAFSSNTVLIGNGTSKIATTTPGTNGQVLSLSNGIPTWVATATPAGYPFTTTTNFGGTVQSTSTALLLTAGLQASSSVQFGNGGASNFTYDSANGALDLGVFSSLAQTPLRISTTTNNFVQALIQNLSNGNNASSEFVVSNDKDSTSATYFLDVGINGSGYKQAAFNSENASDAFIVASDGALVVGTASTTNTLADLRFETGGTASSSIRLTIKQTGNVGISTTSPFAKLSVQGLAADGNSQALFAVGTSTNAATSTPFIVANSGATGIGTSSPFAELTLDRQLGVSSSTVAVNEYSYGTATSTSELIDCRTALQQHFRIGFSATTLQLNTSSMVPGQSCRIVVENPNGTAGAITWTVTSGLLLWTGGSVPTQTTTANKMDVWSFIKTQGSSTPAILGAQTPNF